MNTADRSLVALDTALRRRFQFKEMMPQPQLVKERVPVEKVDGVDVSEVMAVLNRRIVALYDREHQLGHSYFMDIEDLNDLKDVFMDRVIPMLQEYFHEDYEKISLVLSTADNTEKSYFVFKSDMNKSGLVFAKKGRQPVSDMYTYEVISRECMNKEIKAEHFIQLYKATDGIGDEKIDS